MNFTTVYVGFLVVSSIFRMKSLIWAYSKVEDEEPVETKKTITYMIMLFLYITIFLCAPLEYFFIDYPKEVNLLVSLIGFLIYVSIVPLRRWAVESLGRFMSPDIEIKKNHQLIKSGPYRYIRHPLALCIILEAVSLCLIPNSYFSLTLALVIFVPFMIVRIHIEEKALIGKFGDEYLSYIKEIGGLFPKIKIR
ncbi:TPA: hypothetical protein DCX16_04925 [bacterium]|nr:hypothetical protein [bacterium]